MMGCMLRARVTFLPTAQGGRYSPCTTGYRGQFHWKGEDEISESSMQVIPERWAQPGESTDARFSFTENSTSRLAGRIKVGDHFELREGRTVVAFGTVTEIEE